MDGQFLTKLLKAYFLVPNTQKLKMVPFSPPKPFQELVLAELVLNSAKNTFLVMFTSPTQPGVTTTLSLKKQDSLLNNTHIGMLNLEDLTSKVWLIAWNKLLQEVFSFYTPVPITQPELTLLNNNGKKFYRFAKKEAFSHFWTLLIKDTPVEI